MSVEPKQKAPSIDPQLLNQLLAGEKTAGEIEDLLKDLRKAFIKPGVHHASSLGGKKLTLRRWGVRAWQSLGRNTPADPARIGR